MQTTSSLRSWEPGMPASCLTPRNDTRRRSGRSLRKYGQLQFFIIYSEQLQYRLATATSPHVLACVQQARAAEEEKAARYREFTLGKLAYAKGEYPTSIQYFKGALDREGPFSPMGGEIQLWLALGYQVLSLNLHSTNHPQEAA